MITDIVKNIFIIYFTIIIVKPINVSMIKIVFCFENESNIKKPDKKNYILRSYLKIMSTDETKGFLRPSHLIIINLLIVLFMYTDCKFSI